MIINSLNKINLDAIVHKTYKEAAVARGLSLDDQEYDDCMAEAARNRMPYQLRQLFFNICSERQITNPRGLFNKHEHDMIDDYKHRYPIIREGDIVINDEAHMKQLWRNLLLRDLNNLFKLIGETNASFDIPMPDESFQIQEEDHSKEFSFSRFSIAQNRERGIEMWNKLNGDQQAVFKEVMESVESVRPLKQTHFWMEGCGGTGKTFLLNVSIF